VGTAYFVSKNTKATFVGLAYDMEAFNELYRITSWDRLEQLLIKGCNKEALEYVRMEQSLGLSGLQWHLNNGAKLEKKVEGENQSIVSRARSFTSKGRYDIPTCK
jgi:hypothetical protein